MTTTPITVDLAALLDGLVRRDGVGLLDDRRRLHGLLRDYAPDSIASIRTMMAAYDGGLVARLREAAAPLSGSEFERETTSVAEAAGCSAASAETAVANWVRVVATATGSAGPMPLPLPNPLPLPLPFPGKTPARRSRPIRLAGGIAAALAMGAVAARLLGYL